MSWRPANAGLSSPHLRQRSTIRLEFEYAVEAASPPRSLFLAIAFQLFKAQIIRLFVGTDTGLHSGYTFCDFDWYQQVPTNDNMQKCIRAQFESPIQNTLPWSTWLEREVISTP
jgi:hypothetical protein